MGIYVPIAERTYGVDFLDRLGAATDPRKTRLRAALSPATLREVDLFHSEQEALSKQERVARVREILRGCSTQEIP